MNSPFLLTSLLAALIMGGCASDTEVRQQLRHIESVSINNNVDFSGEGIAGDRQSKPVQQAFVAEFIRQVNRTGVFPKPISVVRTSLQTWREEVGEMKYDAQIKLNIRPGQKEGAWLMEALLESRYGAVLWRSAKTVTGEASGPNQSAIDLACQELVRDLKRARN